MKIRVVGFDNELETDDKYINVIEIYEKKLFNNIVSKLYDAYLGLEVDNDFKIIEGINEKNIKKCVYFVDNIFNINFNDKKIVGKLYTELEKNIIEMGRNHELNNLVYKFIEILNNTIKDFDISIKYDDVIETKNLFKLFNIKVEEPASTSIIENIYLLIDLIVEFKLYEFILFVNLKTFISSSDILELYKYATYKQINIILIESNSCESRSENEQVLVIDEQYEDYII